MLSLVTTIDTLVITNAIVVVIRDPVLVCIEIVVTTT